MYTQKEIIICKFFIHGKCKFGRKCSYLHIKRNDLSKFFEQLNQLQTMNESLKKELSKRNQEIRELKSEKSKNKQTIIDEVHTSDNRLYSSFIY